ncbi:MAG: hypothetical protein ABI704_30215 [Kofleriaceae bacterium]
MRRTITFAGISSITSVTSWPMQTRSLPHFRHARCSGGTAIGFSTRGKCSGACVRDGGCRGGRVLSAARSSSGFSPSTSDVGRGAQLAIGVVGTIVTLGF